MSTKAENSQYQKQRSGPKKEKRVPHRVRRTAAVETRSPEAIASNRHGDDGYLNRRDRSKKAARKIHVRVRGAAGFRSGR
jgi:hypothetical protein